MSRPSPLFPVLFAGVMTLGAQAQAQSTDDQPGDQGAPPRVVKVRARTNPGDLEYRWVYDDQNLLQSFLPAQGRMVDFSWRITFTELNLPEQDAWTPHGWAVAIVESGFEQDVPVARGGYFLLPALPLGRRSSTIMFHDQSLEGNIATTWRLRVGADQRLAYAGFQQAMDEVHHAQNAIPVDREGLRLVRAGRYDALKACFLAPGGQVLVGGVAAADARVGNCTVLKFDPARRAGGAIEFKGPLDVVTVVESADYLNYVDLPALAATSATAPGQAGAAAGSSAAAAAAPVLAAPTNLSNPSYAWNYKHQQRLQGGLNARAHLVDFVWRISLDGASPAQQDAWAPQGWTLALAGKGYARAVPVARGGYFLLPALPAAHQDASLVFREQGRRNLVAPAWVLSPRSGPRPYLYYGELGEAMKAVRQAQQAIPDGRAELAALRASRYDGVKACFLEAGGVVLVGDAPAADATVGNCAIVKFDPARDANEKVEFVGRLDAVTVVDTAAYLHAGG